MNAPLYNELIAYSNSKLAFHMPGHKFGSIADLNKLNLSSLDNTEAMGLDNLYEAEGIIKEAMLLMADFYGAMDSVFLTNGSTAGVITSILATCNEGDELIVARNSHHSVWSALVLGGIRPIYISPEYVAKDDILGEITPETVRRAFKAYPRAKGIIIVSPTYEGIVSDIKAIAEVVHEYDKVLIVDEAHGAHFVLGNCFPISSTRLGADLVINSMHKTLPALTQSALIHICSHRISYEKIIETLRMVQTSSPSYMMMGLMDYIRCYILEHHVLIKKQYVDELVHMRERLKELRMLRLVDRALQAYDISKVVISTANANISGYQLATILNKEYSIVVEAALETYVILMTTMADTRETLHRLEQALKYIDSCLQYTPVYESINSFLNNEVVVGESTRSIHYSEKKWEVLDKCDGKKSAKNIMLYPPGIPIVCIGEVIQAKHIYMIRRFKNKLQGIKVVDNEILLHIV
ncbi:aminotransferase class I/II-fold pyridoxal phosphate-dependent enzyme [Cellulosilyticum ruminicola]|uniref:aminotransferase class I/II-fold pyridoxal phosphate-dependent enzyme n=1 Tax=Cellulosilyticum ruminicola TaxID=425254 RepID=UPI0006D191A5|nr:aminotransferase class I/II-fold pyridoxal phosphate-dependent enzyme [Cellulosilyticum ruminicola]